MNRLTIRIIRAIRGESGEEMRLRLRNTFEQLYKRNTGITPFIQAARRYEYY